MNSNMRQRQSWLLVMWKSSNIPKTKKMDSIKNLQKSIWYYIRVTSEIPPETRADKLPAKWKHKTYHKYQQPSYIPTTNIPRKEWVGTPNIHYRNVKGGQQLWKPVQRFLKKTKNVTITRASYVTPAILPKDSISDYTGTCTSRFIATWLRTVRK